MCSSDLSAKPDLLLLLGGAEGLTIALIEQIGENLTGGKVLLPSEVRARQPPAFPAKGARSDLLTEKRGLFLLLLLPQVRKRRTNDVLQIRRHVLLDLLTAEFSRRHAARAGNAVAGRQFLIRLCARQTRRDVLQCRLDRKSTRLNSSH